MYSRDWRNIWWPASRICSPPWRQAVRLIYTLVRHQQREPQPGQEKILLNDFGGSFNPHEAPRYAYKTVPHLRPPQSHSCLCHYSHVHIWDIRRAAAIRESLFWLASLRPWKWYDGRSSWHPMYPATKMGRSGMEDQSFAIRRASWIWRRRVARTAGAGALTWIISWSVAYGNRELRWTWNSWRRDGIGRLRRCCCQFWDSSQRRGLRRNRCCSQNGWLVGDYRLHMMVRVVLISYRKPKKYPK